MASIQEERPGLEPRVNAFAQCLW